jgi:hypothetical protein
MHTQRHKQKHKQQKHNAAFIRRVASLPGKLHVLASYISLELMNRELLLGDNIFHQIAD